MLRNLVARLVCWLCVKFEISVIDETRKAMGGDAIARSDRWHSFAVEDGGLYDIIDRRRREAFEAYADTRPGDTAEKEYLAMQDRCWRQIKAQVGNIIESGRIEASRTQRQAVTLSPIKKSV